MYNKGNKLDTKLYGTKYQFVISRELFCVHGSWKFRFGEARSFGDLECRKRFSFPSSGPEMDKLAHIDSLELMVLVKLHFISHCCIGLYDSPIF